MASTLRLGLRSDFSEYYDDWFDKEPYDLILDRSSAGGLAKKEQFLLLDQIGFPVPMHGLVKDVAPATENDWLVVYPDENTHRGEGKSLLRRTLAEEAFPESYCSIFIPTSSSPESCAISKQLLAIGEQMWWLSCQGEGSWQSNHAPQVSVSVLRETLGRRSYALEGDLDFSLLDSYPLVAIDFVYSIKRQQLMAIGFSTAPVLANVMESAISAADVVGLLKVFLITRKLGI